MTNKQNILFFLKLPEITVKLNIDTRYSLNVHVYVMLCIVIITSCLTFYFKFVQRRLSLISVG